MRTFLSTLFPPPLGHHSFSEVFGTSYANFASSVDGLNGHMDTEKACFSAASSNAVTATLIAAVAALAVVFA